MQKNPGAALYSPHRDFLFSAQAAPPRCRPDQCFSGTAIDVIAMIMMAAMAQTETIIFFIILVPFVSFLYDYILPQHAGARKCAGTGIRSEPVLIRCCMRPVRPVLLLILTGNRIFSMSLSLFCGMIRKISTL